MSKITFNKNKSQKTTVNNLLNTILPGHSVTTSATSIFTPSKKQSTTEIISKFNKRLSKEEIYRVNKSQKSQLKKQAKSDRKINSQIRDTVQLNLIKSTHAQSNSTVNMNKDEKLRYKQLLAKQISSVLSMAPDPEVTGEIQDDILNLVNSKQERLKNKKGRKVQGKTVLYKKKNNEAKGYNFKGLTPGLAPVDMEDPDSDDE